MAGGGACGKRAPAAIDLLRQAGLEVDVVETTAAGDGRRIAREALLGGARRLIAVGGDGTASEVVNGLLAAPEALAELRPRLGFLPLGTGNSFLRDFSDRGPEYAIESLISERCRACDVIRVTHADGEMHFINIFSVGFVAAVGALRNRRFARLGELGYIIAVSVEVARLGPAHFPMAIDDGPADVEPVIFVAVTNSRFTGGKMLMAPAADTGDGLLDVVRLGVVGRGTLLRTFPKIFAGTHVNHPAVRTSQGQSVTFDLDRSLDVLIDGEVVEIQPRRLDVLPGAIDVIA